MWTRISSRRIAATLACLGAGLTAMPSARANTPPTIDPIDDASVFAGDEIRFRVVPRDADGDVPGLKLIDWPRGVLFSDNGDGTRTFRWTPTNSDAGRREFVFEAFDALDGSLAARRTVAVTVLEGDDPGGNRAPEFESLIDREIAFGGAFDFRVVPRDPEGIVPSVRIDRLPAGATFVDNGDGTRQFRWRPGANAPRETVLRFITEDAFDPSLRTSRSITLRIANGGADEDTGAGAGAGEGGGGDSDAGGNGDQGGGTGNTAPFFVGLVDRELDLGDTFEIRVEPRDNDGSVPGLSIDRLPPGAAFDDNRDGTRTFRWRPLPINLGDTFVTFNAIDANDAGLRTSRTIRLRTVRNPDRPVNFPPVINGIRNPVIRIGDTLNQRVQALDPDFVVPQLVALDSPPGSSFPDNGDGTRTLRWKVGRENLGDTPISFRATDVEDASATFDSTITVSVIEPDSLRRDGERLRDLADARGFGIGYAAVLQASKLADNQLYRDIAAEEFNLVTPENSHKMGWIQPMRGVFEWADADDLADYAEANGMKLHGHPLVWFAQLPSWVQSLDPADAEQVMYDHIDALVSRYQGRVAIWDVVNEALEKDGSLREPIWFEGMGADYIGKAFRRARERDPEAELIYNDYDVIWENEKSDAMYELLSRELASGTPIDGVGFQMHLRGDFDRFDSVVRNLQRFAELGLDIYITEFDVALDGEPDLASQADLYRKSLEICLAQPACKSMQSWGFTDRYSWRSGNRPLLFTDRYEAKPAYYAWQKTLREFDR